MSENTNQVQFVVEGPLGEHKWWARALTSTYTLASKTAKVFATGEKLVVRIRKITGEELKAAEFQIEKIDDWNSDPDFWPGQ